MTKPDQDKPARKPGKKSETLEVRLPYETKRDFLDACRADGTTASEVVRQSIDGYLETRTRTAEASSDPKGTAAMNVIQFIPRPLRRPRRAAGALGAVGRVVVTAQPSAANPDFRSLFDRLDSNGDGVLTAEEFGGSRAVSASGDKPTRVVIEKRVVKRDENGEVEETETIEHDGKIVTEIRRGAPIELSISGEAGESSEAYAYWLPVDPAGVAGDGRSVAIMNHQNEVRVTVDGEAASSATVNILPNPFAAFDADGDGKISYAEFETHQRTLLVNGFNRLDKDKDGSLSPEEYAAIGAPLVLTIGGDGRPNLPAEVLEKLKSTAPGMDPEAMKAKSAERFAALDKNRDGRLSLQEYLPQ